jgi:hypothetical protein
VIVDIRANRATCLNTAGSAIWAGLSAPATAEDLAAAVADELDLAIVAATRRFLDQLVEAGLAVRERAEEEAVVRFPAAEDAAGPGPPQILWQDDLQKFAGACAQYPGNPPSCPVEQQFS